MRIVGGEWGGRSLKSPAGQTTRPTSDRVRESMFNILLHSFGADFHSVIDCFAGTGALGLEALSRGAESCIFFEENKQTLKVLNANLESCRVPETSYRLNTSSDLFSWRTFLKSSNPFKPIDLIFSDPPYHKNWTDKFAISVSDHPALVPLLSPNCIWVAELASDERLPKLKNWKMLDQRVFGDTQVIFYQLSPS